LSVLARGDAISIAQSTDFNPIGAEACDGLCGLPLDSRILDQYSLSPGWKLEDVSWIIADDQGDKKEGLFFNPNDNKIPVEPLPDDSIFRRVLSRATTPDPYLVPGLLAIPVILWLLRPNRRARS